MLIEPLLDYRRNARRVRCRLGHDSIGKQHALAALAKRVDRVRRRVEPEPIQTADNGVRAFAKAVSEAMDGPILRFSRRQELIWQAESLGIRRFDANLLIAAVQHRLGSERAVAVVPSKTKHSAWRIALPVGLAIALQAIIVLSVWGLLHS